MTMMLIAQGGAKMAQTGSRLLQPKYKNTRAGQIQRNRSRQGNLSQAQENTIMNRVGVNAGRTAEVARNRYAGSMINQGMGNSVAMNRGLREAQDDVRRTQYDTARGIYQNEELAKSNAKMNYAQAMDQDKAERRNAGIGMVSTALDTAGQYLGSQATGAETLTLDDKRNIEMYAQKANIKNSTSVSDTFESFLSGELDSAKFIDKMKTLDLTNEQITELMKQLIK